MKLDRNLNLVLTLTREPGPNVYLHSMPLSRAAFEGHYALIARAEAELFARGRAYYVRSGARVAALTLRTAGAREAADMGDPGGDGGASMLLEEIKRLTNIVFATPQGWTTLPAERAIQQQIISAGEWSEQENAIVFFILVSAMARRADLPTLLDVMASFMAAQVVPQNSTEFAASLPISKPDASPPPPIQSSVPR